LLFSQNPSHSGINAYLVYLVALTIYYYINKLFQKEITEE